MNPANQDFELYQGSTFIRTITKRAEANLINRGTWSVLAGYDVDDFVVWEGSTYKCIVAHTTAQQPPNATYWGSITPQDLSTSTIQAMIRRTVESSVTSGSFTIDMIDAPNGKFTISLSAAQTDLLDAGTYYYDLEITTGPIVDKIMAGKIIVLSGVTR